MRTIPENTENLTEKLWGELYLAVYRYIFSKVKNQDQTADLVQEVFMKIHLNIGKVLDNQKLTPWVYSIAHNTVMDHFRQHRFQEQIEKINISEDTDLAQETYNQEFSKCILTFIQELDYKDQELLKEIEFGNTSQKEMAEKMGLKYSTLKSRLQRARNRLKAQLQNCCLLSKDCYGNISEFQQKRGNNCCQ